MLKRLLVLLEDHDYSRAGVEYSVHLATDEDMELTGLSVVDIPSIEKSIGPVPLGGDYYAQKEEEQRISAEKEMLSEIEQKFTNLCQANNIQHRVFLREGNGADIILDEMKYHDLIVMGYETSIHFGHKKDKSLQQHIISQGIQPVLLIPEKVRDIQRVLVCYDGSFQAAKTIHKFVQLGIWRKRELTLLTVEKDDEKEKGDRLLERMADYISVCCEVSIEKVCLSGKPADEISSYVETHDFDLIVMGAYGRSAIHHFFFGSLTNRFIETANRPIFIYH